MGDFGASAVAEMLLVNRTVTSLSLAGNGIGVCIENRYLSELTLKI